MEPWLSPEANEKHARMNRFIEGNQSIGHSVPAFLSGRGPPVSSSRQALVPKQQIVRIWLPRLMLRTPALIKDNKHAKKNTLCSRPVTQGISTILVDIRSKEIRLTDPPASTA